MSRVEENKNKRKRFLNALYEAANGSLSQLVHQKDFSEQLNEALAIADYLADSGLLRIEVDEGTIYRITVAGINAVEAQHSNEFHVTVDHSESTKVELAEEIPSQIRESLQRFQEDYPDPSKVAFIMMQFNDTKAHREISRVIKDTLADHGIVGIRADEKEYHEDLYPKVRTYMHGCGMGIAVFERIESEDFNPNVSLELEYMYAMQRPVCLLKDRTLRSLHTDLFGKLYRQFDFQDPSESIPSELSSWLSDRELV